MCAAMMLAEMATMNQEQGSVDQDQWLLSVSQTRVLEYLVALSAFPTAPLQLPL